MRASDFAEASGLVVTTLLALTSGALTSGAFVAAIELAATGVVFSVFTSGVQLPSRDAKREGKMAIVPKVVAIELGFSMLRNGASSTYNLTIHYLSESILHFRKFRLDRSKSQNRKLIINYLQSAITLKLKSFITNCHR